MFEKYNIDLYGDVCNIYYGSRQINLLFRSIKFLTSKDNLNRNKNICSMQKILKNFLPIITSSSLPNIVSKAAIKFNLKSNIIRSTTTIQCYNFNIQFKPVDIVAVRNKMTQLVDNKATDPKDLIPFLESLEKTISFFKLANTPLPLDPSLMSRFYELTIDSMSKFENPNDFFISAQTIIHMAKNDNEVLKKLTDLLTTSDLLFGIKKSNLTKILLAIQNTNPFIMNHFYSGFLLQLKKFSNDMKLSTLIYFLSFSHSYFDSTQITEEQRQIFIEIMEKNSNDIPNVIKTLDSDNLVGLLSLSFSYLQTNRDRVIKTTIDFIAKYYESIQINNVINLIHVLTAMKYEDEDLWYHLAEVLIIKMHSLSTYQLMKIVNCYSHIGYNHNLLFEEIVQKLTLSYQEIEANTIPPLMHSLSLLRTNCSSLIEKLQKKIIENLKNYSIDEIVTIFSASSTLNSTNKELAKNLEQELLLRPSDLRFRHLESLTNGLIHFYRHNSKLFENISKMISEELDKNIQSTEIDEAVMAAMFGITKDAKPLLAIFDKLIEYSRKRLDSLLPEDSSFVLNLGGMLGMYGKGFAENPQFKELANIFLDKASVYRDTYRVQLSSNVLSALQSMIFAIKNEAYKVR